MSENIFPLIRAKNLSKIYDGNFTETSALGGVSFDVEAGEFLAIMGPSGSGKSTLLHILGFLDKPTSGDYYFEGKKMEEFNDEELAGIRNKKMGFVFQSFNLLRRTALLENVKLPLKYAGIAEKEQDAMARRALAAVNLPEETFSHEPSQLSGGEQQRAAIARAIVNNPSIIFADEPTGNLDSKSGEIVMQTLQKLNNEGNTVILITHETFTAEYAQRIIRLLDGQIESDNRVSNRRFNGFIK
ncbi:MAG: ABC transporter ATP-binding protein [bacterium]|nr:ABC transporter ATP-binding protein [bacterium]